MEVLVVVTIPPTQQPPLMAFYKISESQYYSTTYSTPNFGLMGWQGSSMESSTKFEICKFTVLVKDYQLITYQFP